jgi:hypothetical protein
VRHVTNYQTSPRVAAQYPTNDPVVTLRSALMEIALIAAGAAIFGSLATGGLGYLQARLTARRNGIATNTDQRCSLSTSRWLPTCTT